MNLLFVNSCIRDNDTSRTYRLCRHFLEQYRMAHPDTVLKEVILREENLAPLLDNAIQTRDQLISKGDFSIQDFRFARDFAEADVIVVGAPYWDLSFPAILKIYIEHICVNGITFHYTANGQETLCHAKEMVYITTSGGMIGKLDLGSEYMKGICSMLGIKKFQTLSAQGLDIQELNAEDIMTSAIQGISAAASI